MQNHYQESQLGFNGSDGFIPIYSIIFRKCFSIGDYKNKVERGGAKEVYDLQCTELLSSAVAAKLHLNFPSSFFPVGLCFFFCFGLRKGWDWWWIEMILFMRLPWFLLPCSEKKWCTLFIITLIYLAFNTIEKLLHSLKPLVLIPIDTDLSRSFDKAPESQYTIIILKYIFVTEL